MDLTPSVVGEKKEWRMYHFDPLIGRKPAQEINDHGYQVL